MSKLMRELAEEGRRARREAVKLPLGRAPSFVRYWFLDKAVEDVPIKNESALHGTRKDFAEVAERVNELMTWEETTEGEAFWSWVYCRLYQYSSKKA